MVVNTPLVVRALIFAIIFIVLEGFVGYLEPRFVQFIPNFCIVLVAILALYEQSPIGAITVFLLGILVDCSGADYYVGPWAAVYLSLYLGVLFLPESLLNLSISTVVFLSFIGSFVGDIFYESLTFESWAVFALVWAPACIRSIIVVLGAPIVYRCIRFRNPAGDVVL